MCGLHLCHSGPIIAYHATSEMTNNKIAQVYGPSNFLYSYLVVYASGKVDDFWCVFTYGTRIFTLIYPSFQKPPPRPTILPQTSMSLIL